MSPRHKLTGRTLILLATITPSSGSFNFLVDFYFVPIVRKSEFRLLSVVPKVEKIIPQPFRQHYPVYSLDSNAPITGVRHAPVNSTFDLRLSMSRVSKDLVHDRAVSLLGLLLPALSPPILPARDVSVCLLLRKENFSFTSLALWSKRVTAVPSILRRLQFLVLYNVHCTHNKPSECEIFVVTVSVAWEAVSKPPGLFIYKIDFGGNSKAVALFNVCELE